MDAEDVVVHGEHVKVRRGGSSLGLDRDLSVVDPREVAGTGRLMLLGLKRERVAYTPGMGEPVWCWKGWTELKYLPDCSLKRS